jgi:MYXO-CTERM domain-containing protein
MHLLNSSAATKLIAAGVGVAVASFFYMARTAPDAEACGCFAPPDPSVPIVQSGERIAFGVKDGTVTAHIQIQYSGDAEEFAWLVPLPSEPTMKLGTDELFAQLISTTQPKYRVTREYFGGCEFGVGGFGNQNPSPSDDADGLGGGAEGEESPLVMRDSIGPYDYAVLRADSKQPMLDWLADNRFFVPAGTDEAIDPYIRPGGFFLALKLLNGESSGDLQPVVLEYESSLPMIPIVLTSVAADPDMGIMVWVLGDDRAIPRNYYHTVINDAAIDWLDFGSNYVDVVTRAVDEAEGHRSFVTEYAGTSAIMQDLLDYDWRFGDLDELRARTDAVEYVQYLLSYGYAINSNQPPFFGPQFSSQMLGLLGAELPVPQGLLDEGITPNDYYTNISWYLGWYRDENPELYGDLDVEFDPATLTDDIEARVVIPTLEAGQLFRDHDYMTRMFTTLSPEEMKRDPVFSFNPDLPDVSNVHDAVLRYYCSLYGDSDQQHTPARLITEQGWELDLPGGEETYDWPQAQMPKSRYIQVLREEGDAETVTDNDEAIDSSIDSAGGSGGCSIADGSTSGLAGLVLLSLMVGFVVIRRRRD